MWACRCKGTTAFPPISLSSFIKHLPTPELNPPPTLRFPLRSINRISLPFSSSTTTISCLNSRATPAIESLNSQQKDQISLYVDALLQWNQKMNLTAVTEKSEVMERHIEDSLAILPPIEDYYAAHCGEPSRNLSLVDVGTGAGLPGFILAIARPDWKVTLLESMNKRCVFLEHAIDITGLSNVQVLKGRAENYGKRLDLRETFDVAVARAVAELRILAEYCLPLVRVGGLFVAAKGHDIQEELKNAERAMCLLGASDVKQCTVESYSPYGQRTAIVCLKGKTTPRQYPRDPGTPAKMPLYIEQSDKFRAMLKGVKVENVVRILQDKAIRFMQNRSQHATSSFLGRWMKDISMQNNLDICLVIIEEGCKNIQSGFFGDETEAVDCALECIYSTSATNKWNTMASIISKLPHPRGAEIQFQNLERRLKLAEGHIETGRLLALYQAFNGKKWDKFNKEKVASLAYAGIQGRAALVAHFQNSSLMNEDKRCRPILFHSEDT